MICIHVFCKHRFSSFAPANVGPIQGKQPDAPCRTINIDFPVMIGEWFWFGASTYLIPPNPLGMLLAQPTWRVSWGQNHPLYTVKLSLSWPWGLKGAVGPNFGKPETCQREMSEKSGEWLQANLKITYMQFWALQNVKLNYRWFLSSSTFCLTKEKHEHVAIPGNQLQRCSWLHINN